MRNLKYFLLALSCALLLLGCGQGGGSNSGADRVAAGLTDFSSAPEIEGAYTVVVSLPDVSKNTTTTIYNNLLTNLTSASSQAKVPISRILLTTVSPSINNVFNVDKQASSLAVSFLSQLADFNQKNPSLAIQVIAYPDVEPGSPWLGWDVSQYNSIPSCALAQTTQDQSQKAMLISICWASAVNKLIGSKIISGVVYDQQSNWLAKTYPSTQISWTHDQAHGDQLLIGWISTKGIAATAGKVDLNFLEVYDLYSNDYPYYDSIALETIHTVVGSPIACNNGLCSYGASNKGTPPLSIFPGILYDYPYTDNKGNAAYAGGVGANIYQCAISQDLIADSCTNYASIIETSQPPSAQVMQAFNYIWNGSSKPPPIPSHFGGSNDLSGNVIYLFSAQYIGPQKSYFANPTITSRNQCSDPSAPANSCSCMATLYNPYAYCGAANAFGSWGGYLSEFINFTKLFLGFYGSNNCPGQSCSAGIFMYDYIPQAWYTK